MRRIHLSSIVVSLALLLVSAGKIAAQGGECSAPPATQTIPDCTCRHETVQQAVTSFISPLLSKIATTTFFRYFFVELERPCPFWKENGLCMMEACSVCTCPDEEVPKAWIESSAQTSADVDDHDFGWISNKSSTFGFHGDGHDESLGKISFSENLGKKAKQRQSGNSYGGYKEVKSAQKSSHFFQQLYQTEDCDTLDEWTELHAPLSDVGVYVNLLQNPERFTGYAGQSARRVWTAIKEENCFGSGVEEVCLEKRIFYRLMSGMQASISTHIARQYLHSDGKWGINLPLYWNAVGNHPDRVDNLYLAFLFLLRATMKAKNVLLNYPYDTGNKTDDSYVRELVNKLFSHDNPATSAVPLTHSTSPIPPVLYGGNAMASSDPNTVKKAVAECSYGFNEQRLFQVPDDLQGPSYWQQLEEKQQLREEFRLKFRNISRIMDCVTCEKCRLWGKLQVLGLGTAIKILLSNEDELVIRKNVDLNPRYAYNGYGAATSSSTILNRQEVIALINALNQFSKSVEFSAFANAERQREIEEERLKQELKEEAEEEIKAQEEVEAELAIDPTLSEEKKQTNEREEKEKEELKVEEEQPAAASTPLHTDSIDQNEKRDKSTEPPSSSNTSNTPENDNSGGGLPQLYLGIGFFLVLLFLVFLK